MNLQCLPSLVAGSSILNQFIKGGDRDLQDNPKPLLMFKISSNDMLHFLINFDRCFLFLFVLLIYRHEPEKNFTFSILVCGSDFPGLSKQFPLLFEDLTT